MKELILIFLRLGTFAFGGPAAHIAMMEKEFVEKRAWLSHDEFLDLMGFTNLIPGPNSTEMALHIGYLRHKGKGMLAAGAAFILPATLMVLGLSYLLKTYGSIPSVSTMMTYVTPVIVALIASVIYTLGKKQLTSPISIAVFVVTLALSLVWKQELLILLGAGLIYLLLNTTFTKHRVFEPLSLTMLFLIFLKIGSVLYGSGYVLLSFLKTEFVVPNYLDLQTVIDAMTLGQITPGPVFTTATAIGYLLHGVPGGILATLGIFLPSFILVYVLHPLFPKLQSNPTLKKFLEGVKLASLALMMSVVIELCLGFEGLIPFFTFMIANTILTRTKINPTWLILCAALIGLLQSRFF